MKQYELSTAEQKVFDDNKKLVSYTLYKYFNYSTIKDFGLRDATNWGYLGLIKAIKTFDETKNMKFCTFAINSIHYSILTAMKSYNKHKSRECESIDSFINTELLGYSVNGCRELITLDYITPLMEKIADRQIVEQLHDIAKQVLSENYYKIYELYYIKGLKVKQISETLNLSDKRIYGILKKITFKLKERIKAEERNTI